MAIDPEAIPDMLHWYEGMLLLPEHFQMASRRQEALSGYLAQVAVPYAWGLRRLKIVLDADALQIVELEAVMPDGLLVRYNKDRDKDLSLRVDLKDLKPDLDARKRQTIHLVVPAWSGEVLGQEGPEAGGLTRYRSVPGARLEQGDVEGPAESAAEAAYERPWLRPALALFANDGPLKAPPIKYTSLPLLRLFQNAESAIVVDEYEPPCTHIGTAPRLQACARNVIDELRAKAGFLNERLRRDTGLPSRKETAALPSIEMQLRLLARRFEALQNNVENLQALARPVPRLQALLRDGNTHPFTLYLALCDVIGDLALLGGDLNLPDVPAYAHADPLLVYDFLRRHILWMLATLNQKYRVIAFERINERRFEHRFKPGDFGSSFIIGAVREPGMPASQILTWMSNAAIVTEELRPDLKRRRVGGARREPIERDDALDLSAPSMTSLFRVHVDGDIRPDESTLVVENKAADGPRDILLYVPRDPDEVEAQRIGA